MATDKPLRMTFTPSTIEHPGVRMYSTLPPVLGELVANAYDADAPTVTVELNDSGEKEIIVSDDGHGMSYEEINSKFLRIGRNRRAGDVEKSPGGRSVIGKKGLGKLSFFGIAREIEVSTVKDGLRNTFKLDWDANVAEDEHEGTQQASYEPLIIEKDVKMGEKHGTTVTLRQLERISDFGPEAIADSLAKLFIIDKGFEILVSHNGEEIIVVDNARRFRQLPIQFTWKVPGDIESHIVDYLQSMGITGEIYTTEKPIPPKTILRGITLFSRNKLVNMPEYFSESASSNFYSYLTGWLEVDFIDEIKPDVIGTSRQSLDWRRDETEELRGVLQKLVRWVGQDWRKRRKEQQEKKTSEKTGINISDWTSKVPEDIGGPLKSVISTLSKGSIETPETEEVAIKAVQKLHELVPEYPKFHWRHLHPEIQRASKASYELGDYYTAFSQAAMRFVESVRQKSGVDTSKCGEEGSLMEKVFRMGDPILSVTEGFRRPSGNDFQPATIKGVRNGQARLSTGVMYGGRNIVGHVESEHLRDSGLFTEKDCLDMLSLLSHLMYRMDNSTKMRDWSAVDEQS